MGTETIARIQDRIVADFEEIGDAFDQYSYLVEISGMLPPMSDALKTPERLVEGCQSHVWLHTALDEDGMFLLEADSDTFIVKGVLELLEEMFCGQNPADVAQADVNFLERTEITATFDADRQKGIGYVIATIRRQASELA